MSVVPSIRDQPLPPRAMSPMNYEEALHMGQIENELPGEVRSVVYEALGVSLGGFRGRRPRPRLTFVADELGVSDPPHDWLDILSFADHDRPFPGIVNAPTHSSATHAEPPKRSLNAEETMLIPNHDFWLPPSPQHRMGDMLGYPREDESRQGRDFIDDRECDVRDFTVHMELASQSAAAQPPSDRSTFQLPIVPPPPKKLPEFALVSETETHEGKLHVDAPINIPARDSSPRPLECSQVSRRTSPTSELRPAPLSAGVQAELSAHVESHPTVKERRTPRKTRPGADGRSLKDLVFGKRSARIQRAGNSVAAIDESGDLRQLYGLKPSRPAPAPVIEHNAEIDDVDKTPPSWMSNASIKNPAWYLAATRRSLIKPKTRDVLGSMRLMQDRPLLRGLAQHGLNVTERDTSLQEADLIISPMTAVIFRSLTSFTNASQDSRVLVNSLKVAATFFKRVIVVLCTVPYAAFDKPDINGRSPHDVNPLSQAVVEGLGALRRKVAVGIQRDGTRIIGEVQFAFASHGAAEVGKVLRVIMDREEDMQRKISDGRGDGMVGTRNWLEQDWVSPARPREVANGSRDSTRRLTMAERGRGGARGRIWRECVFGAVHPEQVRQSRSFRGQHDPCSAGARAWACPRSGGHCECGADGIGARILAPKVGTVLTLPESTEQSSRETPRSRTAGAEARRVCGILVRPDLEYVGHVPADLHETG
jgi:hypothetical protein